MNKALILRPHAFDGCSWYRLDQFKDSSRKQNLLDVQFLDFRLSTELFQKVLDKANAYIVRLSDMTALNLLENISVFNLNKPVILDIDDNYDIVDPLSDLYRVYGREEVQIQGEYLWKDGESGFDLKKNKERLSKFHDIMRRVTAIITTCFELKNYAEGFNKNVVIIPNAINFDIWPSLDIRRDNAIRIVWSGGATHYPDLIEIAPVLQDIMRTYPNTHFYMYGVPFEGVIKDLPKDRVHKGEWINVDGHGYRMACLDPDISICPLKDMPFNYFKSSIKYYEMSALSVPTIAKNMPPYKDDITHGENGLLYSSISEFRDCLIRLIENPIERIRLGNSAYNYVRKYRDIHEITKDWAGFINGVIGAYENTTI